MVGRKPQAVRRWKYLTPGDLRNFKSLLFTARVIVEGVFAGRHKSPYRGASAEFIDYRQYHPGDEIKTIDWRAYARTDRYYVKLFEKETDMNAYIVLDASASMRFGGRREWPLLPSRELAKFEYACCLAASLSYLMIKQGDKVGLTVFDQAVRKHIAPGGTFAHLYKLLDVLESQEPRRRTSLPKVLKDIYALCRRRGLLIIISDFLAEPREIFRALNLFRHRNFEIILFHVLHQYEVELPPLASMNFIDAETGERVTVSTADIRAEYNDQMRNFIDTMASLARARNVDYNFVNTATPYHESLQKYLLRRSRL